MKHNSNYRNILLAGLFILLALLGSFQSAQAGDPSGLILTGVIDGPLPGGYPKAIELYAPGPIGDLSQYGVGSANNGGGTDGQEFTFPAIPLAAGTCFYVASEESGFQAFFGFKPDFITDAVNINGDDAIEVFGFSTVIDVFGDILADGTGTDWEHLDGWAYRNSATGPDGSTFVLANWSFSGINALDGETTNASATTPFPLKTYPSPSGCISIEYAPEVASTSPADSASGVAIDTDITVNFSEDVAVSSTWYDLTCTASGTHTATVTGGPSSYTLNPDTDLSEDESCTLTVYASLVSDTDTDDPPDNMAGDFTATFQTVSGFNGVWVINEIHADPAGDLAGDANGDGVRDATQDEFVEIVNLSQMPMDISGWTISDGFGVRHTFPSGSVIPDQCAILIFGGGDPTGTFGGAILQTASESALGFNNGGDTVSLQKGNTTLATYTYGGEGGDNQSLTLDPDVTGTEPLVKHSTASNSGGALFSPGTLMDGTAFPGCTLQLLLSEIVVTPTAGEFIEIHNPNGVTVDLSDVYLTDATFAGGSTYYYNIVTGSNAGGGSFSDFHARFPDGATIAAGEYQTIAISGSTAFSTTYGSDPTYELYEDGAADSVPDMREAFSGSISNQGGLTNSGEVVVLYTWDGNSDLVTDLDYAIWGDTAEAVDKTAVAIDGIDGGSETSTYQSDTALGSQELLGSTHSLGNTWQRDDIWEGTETKFGGNGASGHDETSENLSVTWCEFTPTPNAASNCPDLPDTVALTIPEIQGTGLASPYGGQIVSTQGVVVADFEGSSEMSGFFIQTPNSDADADPLTSEGLFVYTGGTEYVQIGDSVVVTGTVTEFFNLTQLESLQAVTIVSSGNSLPAPTVVTLPVSTIDAWEAFEGMLVKINQELTATDNYNLGRYGEVTLSVNGRLFNPTNVVEPGTAANDLQDLNNRSQIQMDDASSIQNPEPLPPYIGADNTLRAGDTLPSLTGVLNYSFGLYEIHPTEVVTFTRVNERTSAPDDVGGELLVGSLNVLNYFTTIDTGPDICGPSANLDCRGADSETEYISQTLKIVNAILAMDVDVLGLMEIENNAITSTSTLVNEVNAAAVITGTTGNLDNGPAGLYSFINTGYIGTDAIKVALIYKPSKVTPVGGFAILDSSVDPTFLDTKNRPVLLQTFMDNATGEIFSVAVNHLKSKGSDCDDVSDPDTGDGQGNCNLTRTAAAVAMAKWLATDPTSSGDPDFLIIGDLNSYAMEDPIDALKDAGYTDLLQKYVGAEAYSYVFFGQAGYLDHALASEHMQLQVTGTTAWHTNADEPSALDYNSFNQDALYTPGPYRASDHDAIIVGLKLDPMPYKLLLFPIFAP